MAEEESKTITLTGEQLLQALQNERAKLDMLQERTNAVQRVMVDVMAGIDSLTELNKPGTEGKILVNLGAGTYVSALIDKKSKVKRSLAGNIVIDCSSEEAIEELKKGKEGTEKNLQNLQKEQQMVVANINNLLGIIAAARRQAARQQQK